MSDKVQLIKQEIESYKKSMKGLEPHSDFRRGQITAFNQIMQFIESLSEEHASEDLEEYYKNEFLPKEWFAEPGQRTISEFNFFTAKHFAEWQKQKDQETIELAEDQAMKDFLEKACEWLSRNARNYYSAYATSDRLVNDFKQYMEEEK